MRWVTLSVALVSLSGCGDAMLPSDYTGPPVGVVTGNVQPGLPEESTGAIQPQLSLEWLVDSNVSDPLVAQSVSFQRSERLQHDWDIGLFVPTARAKFEVDVERATHAARIGVAKMVYYDDRDGSHRIDWSCTSGACNRVLAISAQYVVFVESPFSCQRVGQLVPRASLTAGYHYYSLDGSWPRELGPTDSMSFVTVAGATDSGPPTTDLRNFAERLVRSWNLGLLDGC